MLVHFPFFLIPKVNIESKATEHIEQNAKLQGHWNASDPLSTLSKDYRHPFQ